MFRTKDDKTRGFKKGIDAEDSRRRRENVTSVLRKQQRDQKIAQRRRLAGPQDFDETFDEDRLISTVNQTLEEQLAQLPNIANTLQSQDRRAVMESVVRLRQILSIRREPPIKEVIQTGTIIPKLVEFLAYDDVPKLQFESAWALTNIASGTTEDTQVVIEHGAVRHFIRLLSSPNHEVRDQSVWALGNIAGDSPECRDLVLRAGAMQPLLELCRPDAPVTLLRNVTWTLSNFCRAKPQPPFELVSPALPVLARLIYSRDDEVLTDACWALSYLSDDVGTTNRKIEAVVASGCVRRIVELLLHKNPQVKTPALRTIGNIVSGDDAQTQAVIRAGVLSPLLALLVDPKRAIRKEVCWALSNITAGNSDQIQSVIDANLIPPLISTLASAEFEVQKEAAWAISNATSSGLPVQIRYIVEQGVIPPLCELFMVGDHRIVLVALEGIENILAEGKALARQSEDRLNPYAQYVEECKGLDYLEELQQHPNADIYQKVSAILREYFIVEEEDPEFHVEDDGTQFTFGTETGHTGDSSGGWQL